MPDEERKGYADFLSIPRLLQHFENGEYHIAHKYWTGNALADCMLAEQHIIMYEDEETGDVLGSVTSMISQSRIESGKVKIEERPLHLPDLMHDIRTIIQPNILNNGIKFNKTGGTISLRIKQTNQAPYGYANYQFIIRDTGIAIDKKLLCASISVTQQFF